MHTLLIVLLVLLLVGAFPAWPHAQVHGPNIIWMILIILLVLILAGNGCYQNQPPYQWKDGHCRDINNGQFVHNSNCEGVS